MQYDQTKELVQGALALRASLAVPVMIDHCEVLRLIAEDLTH